LRLRSYVCYNISVMINIDLTKCRRCGTCVDVCPQATIIARGDGFPVQIHEDACMECGACQRNCAAGAVAVAAGVWCFAALMNEALFGRKASSSCG
jgi:ferredoxin